MSTRTGAVAARSVKKLPQRNRRRDRLRTFDGLARTARIDRCFEIGLNEKMFLLAGICFMAILPLLLFLKVDRSAESGGSEKPDVHLEM